ncbi:class I glutamine amidotransferase-like protein [Gautieria morchelliformis]|nr:class I glutamine amidotransferase-like protein [Gautieria morchelliformis]
MPRALIFIASGTEEMEFTITYDVLVRGGVSCASALVKAPKQARADIPWVKCSRGVRIVADKDLDDIELTELFDLVVVPGGAEGAKTISQDGRVQRMLQNHYQQGKLVAMICAGSVAAKTAKIGLGSALTSHPSVKADLEQDYKYSDDSVVRSENLITSRGPGTTFPFALKLVEALQGGERRQEIQKPMIFQSE